MKRSIGLGVLGLTTYLRLGNLTALTSERIQKVEKVFECLGNGKDVNALFEELSCSRKGGGGLLWFMMIFGASFIWPEPVVSALPLKACSSVARIPISSGAAKRVVLSDQRTRESGWLSDILFVFMSLRETC